MKLMSTHGVGFLAPLYQIRVLNSTVNNMIKARMEVHAATLDYRKEGRERGGRVSAAKDELLS